MGRSPCRYGRRSRPTIAGAWVDVDGLVELLVAQVGLAADGDVRRRAFDQHLVGTGHALAELHAAVDLVEREALGEEVAEVEHQAPWQLGDAEQA
ncbi:hypothetical protein G6F59_018038 [Rhizopus arrhizus]|nr:hypothetical protein G6F59_018038 [Rhizopus arrhizus]